MARCYRLYEQQQKAPELGALLGEYVTRWRRWAAAGLGELSPLCLPYPSFCKSESG
jgi:hypothetical protein